MPRFSYKSALTLFALGISTAGCGGDDGLSSAADAGLADAPPPSCDRQGFSPSTETAERDLDLEVLFYTGTTAMERLTIDFYFSLGAVDGAQSVTLTGQGLDTCAECLLLRTGCGSLTCDTTFMAQTGTLTIETMGNEGQSLVGFLKNAVFREVEIDAGTQKTTLVTGGQSWCIDDYSFNTVVTVP